MTIAAQAKVYGAAFNTLRLARQETRFFKRADLLEMASALYAQIGDTKLAASLDALAQIRCYGAFIQAANA